MNPRPNPYVGPRPFTAQETLPARASEVLGLRRSLLTARILLLHSPSGAGKTSLIEAKNGLRAEMLGRGFVVRRTIRVGRPPPAELAGQVDRYALSAVRSLAEGEAEAGAPAVQSLCEWLDAHRVFAPPTGPGREPTRQRELLIFDQFEEVLTADPTDEGGRRGFFVDLAAALADPFRWALFAVREDYLGALDPWSRLLPTLLGNRYRIDLLGVEAAGEAIRAPAREQGVEFDDDALAHLVDELRETTTPRLDGSVERRPGTWIEPVQLQVVCRRLWSRLAAGDTRVTLAETRELGDVDTALAGFYAEQVEQIAATLGVPERQLRRWVGTRLISPHGIRTAVMRGGGDGDGPSDAAIDALAAAHLIRGEERRGVRWYELAHDRMISPILESNAAWDREHLHPMQVQAELWERQGQPATLLLADEALPAVEAWAAGLVAGLTATERLYLTRSQEQAAEHRRARAAAAALAAEQARRLRQARLGVAALALACVAAVGLLVYAFVQRRTAVEQRRVAEREREAADQERDEADQQRRIADEEKQIADEERDFAEEQRQTAEDQSRLAEEQRQVADLATLEARAASAAELAASRRAVRAMHATEVATAGKLAALGLAADAGRVAAAFKLLTTDPTSALALLGEVESPGEVDGWTALAVAALQRPVSAAVLRDVVAAAPSPDGRLVAAVGRDGRLRVYTRDGAEAAAATGSAAPRFVDVVFGPDGTRLVALAGDGAWVFTVDGGGPALTGGVPLVDAARPGAGSPRRVAVGPGGGGVQVAGVGSDGVVRVWDARAPDAPRTLSGCAGDVRAVAIRGDGGAVVAGLGGGKACVWRLGEARPIVLRRHAGAVHAVGFSARGDRVVTAGQDRSALVWSLAGRRAGDELTEAQVVGHDAAVRSAEFSRGGRLVTLTDDGRARVWTLQAATGTWVAAALEGHRRKLNAARFDPAGTWVATASNDGTARLWPVEADGAVGAARELVGHTRPVTRVAFAGTGESVVTVAGDGTARVWAVAPAYHGRVLARHAGAVRRVGFVGDGDQVVTAADDGTARVWSVDDGGVRATLTPGRGVLAVAVAADGRTAWTGSLAGVAQRWELGGAGARATTELALLADGVTPRFVEFDAGLRRLVTGKSRSVWVVDVAGERAQVPRGGVGGHAGEINHAAFDREATRVVTAGEDGTAQIRGLVGDAAPIVLRGHERSVTHAAFDREGGRVVTASVDGTARVWDAARGEELAVLDGGDSVVRSAEFSHDGRRVATAADDRVVRVWPADGAGDPALLRGHTRAVVHAAFSADDRRLVSGSEDRTARVWDVEFTPERLQALVTAASTVRLTDRQREQLLGARTPPPPPPKPGRGGRRRAGP